MDIKIFGARAHNLKDLNVTIPRNKLVVITGVSGSGKSSLVFDTLFAAAQSELLESLSTYARRAIPSVPAPDIDRISGLSYAIAIEQRALAGNPRSTIGTVTDIYSFIRLLFSRTGEPIVSAGELSFNTPKGACPRCSGLGREHVPNIEKLIDFDKSLNQGAIRHRAWKVGGRYWNIIQAVGLFDMKKPIQKFSEKERNDLLYHPPLNYQNKTPGYVQKFTYEGLIDRLMKRSSDERGLAGRDYDEQFFELAPCIECEGSRLNQKARSVRAGGLTLPQVLDAELGSFKELFSLFKGPAAREIVPHIIQRSDHLVRVGLGYLNLNRSIDTLSGGESQRVKLAKHLGSALRETIYVIDEPSIGLHARDIENLGSLLRQLADRGNSVIVVEHDLEIIKAAEHIIEIGPGAGPQGGQLVQVGSPRQIAKSKSVTGLALSGDLSIGIPDKRRRLGQSFEIRNATLNNLRISEVRFYAGVINCLTGVSGSGKSSLVKTLLSQHPEVIVMDQSPIGNSPRSIVATYVDTFDNIRAEFAAATKHNASLFSFNSEGACPECDGLGYIPFDLHFLGEIDNVCEACGGKRYAPNVLQLCLKGASIADVLEMSVDQASSFFDDEEITKPLLLLRKVGLGYLELGQSLATLSGGERQRLKLVKRLGQKGNCYVLDEPTRGLHDADVAKLVPVLDALVDAGNTIVLVEHDLNMIKRADWIIDLGPGGGAGGGLLVATGRPEEVARVKDSITGQYLRRVLALERNG